MSEPSTGRSTQASAQAGAGAGPGVAAPGQATVPAAAGDSAYLGHGGRTTLSQAGSGEATFFNRTRAVQSIPAKLIGEGRFHLLPVYFFLCLSDLAREGVEHSGSFRFADHIYKFEASGKLGIGTLLDWIVLRLPSARSFRNRYLSARDTVVAKAVALALERERINVLSIPCGIARELTEAATILRRDHPEVFAKVAFHGMDLDEEPIVLSRTLVAQHGLTDRFTFRQGNALDPACYPADLDIVTSTGLCDFLPTEQLLQFFGVVHQVLRPGGYFHTSAMRCHELSDWLMRQLADLHTQYRTMDELESIFDRAPFWRLRLAMDDVGIQTLAVARKAVETR